MGSTAHVVILEGGEEHLDWAAQEADRLEGLWSRFRSDSDVTRVTRDAGVRPTRIAPETFALVEQAIQAWRATAGRFDPTVLHTLEAAGYDETFEAVRARPQARTVVRSAPPGHTAIGVSVDDLLRGRSVPVPGCAGILLDRDACTVMLPEGVGLDLGGIGKGAAADHLATGIVGARRPWRLRGDGWRRACRGRNARRRPVAHPGAGPVRRHTLDAHRTAR